MNFDFTEEQTLLADSVRKFAQAHLAKDALKRAHDPGFPFDVAKLMSRQGMMGITIAEADGGQGGSLMDAVIAIEQTAAVCPRSADVVQFGNLGPISTFAEYGTDYQKKKWLSECLAGHDEPRYTGAGRLRRDDLENVRQAGWHELRDQRHQGVLDLQPGGCGLSCMRFGPGVGGIGSVLVERGRHRRPAAGVHERRAVERAAFRELPHSGGERSAQAPAASRSRDGELQRRAARHRALACLRALLLLSGRASTRAPRQQFGRPLSEFQGLQWKFADMAIKLEGAQLLLYRAAANADSGLPSAQARPGGGEGRLQPNGFEVAHEAVQVMGAAGYSKSSLVEYCMREATAAG